MAHDLHAIIARRGVAESVCASLPDTRVVELSLGLALVPPITDAVAVLSPGPRLVDRARWLLDEEPMPQPLDELLARRSASYAVAFVEAEFFGGE